MKITAALVITIFIGVFLSAATTPQERETSFKQHLDMKESSVFKNLKWRNIGPYFMGGRVTDIEAYEKDPYKFLVATASGGLWITRNNATTWTPIFEGESAISIGDIAISQTDDRLIWVGTGESNCFSDMFPGTGVFKSIDGGKTWENMGLSDTHFIGRIVIHPLDNNIVFVAALGHLYNHNEERGVFKTTDGGKTWEKVLYVNSQTGAVDLVMHPQNPQILYASTFDKEKQPWKMTRSGTGSSIYKTIDGGKTWKKAVNGIPQNKYVGRIGLAVCRSNPDVIYAYLDNQETRPEQKKHKKSESGITIDMIKKMKKDDFLKIDNKKLQLCLDENNVAPFFTAEIFKEFVRTGRLNIQTVAEFVESFQDSIYIFNIKGPEVYKSSDGGESWRKTNNEYLDHVFYNFGYGFGQIRVSPGNENVVFILGIDLFKSIDSGKTFKVASMPETYYTKDEVHVDHHAMWIDPDNPRRILLGNDGGVNISYDEGNTWQNIDNLPIPQCYTINYDYRQPYHIYIGLQDNGVNVGPSNFRYGDRVNTWEMILEGDGAYVQPQPGNPHIVFAARELGCIYRINRKNKKHTLIQPQSGDKNNQYRFSFLSPFIISHHNPYILYMGANKVLKSVDEGENWIEISQDLTDKQHIKENPSYAAMTSLDESALTPNILYAGTEDGNAWVSRQGGHQWENISMGLPKKRITRIVASKFKQERVYVTLSGIYEGDYNTYVFVSENYGKNWTSISSNLPGAEPVQVIREDPGDEDILYLGTDLSIYVSLDSGKRWHSLKCNLPTNPVHDLRIHPREKELMIGTHGRGVYLLPVKPIHQVSEVIEKPLHLFKIEPVDPDKNEIMGENALIIEYFTNDEAHITLSILDQKGRTIKTFDKRAEKGINIIAWDLYTDKKKISRGEYIVVLRRGKYSNREILKVI